MTHLPSYVRDKWGDGCDWYGRNPNEPCWGEVRVVQDYPESYTHFCRGHEPCALDGEPYRPEEAEVLADRIEAALT